VYLLDFSESDKIYKGTFSDKHKQIEKDYKKYKWCTTGVVIFTHPYC
jgi:hypothetical protein